MQSTLIHFLMLWRPLGYLIAFWGMVFEGDMTLFASAFLAREGAFDPAVIAPLAFAATYVSDWLWYCFGRFFCSPETRLGRRFSRLAGPLDRQITSRPPYAIFISKFTYGVNHLTLLRAGALKIAPRKIIPGEVPSAALWVLLVGGLGFFSSASLSYLRRYLHYSELALLFGLVVLLILRHLVSDKLKKDM